MKSDYLAIFEKRGHAYDKAMHTYPNARDAEFLRLLDNVNIQNIQRALDVPAGGGYLRKFFPAETYIDSIEPCKEFSQQTPHLNSNTDLETLSLPTNTYQLVVCLAAIHHVKNKQAFFQRCERSLKKDGLFCIGDICYGHKISQFLDEFAGAHNGTGHTGYYISVEQTHSLANATGLDVIECVAKPCHWEFSNQTEMLEFCRLLFGLCDVSDHQLLDALQQYVGISEQHGKTYLHWQMLYSTLKKPI